jgi:hypothetical protein
MGPVHFGLGPDSVAELVELLWPSGIVQTLHHVPTDQVIKVTEAQKSAAY